MRRSRARSSVSSDKPSAPKLLAEFYRECAIPLRVRILECLLKPVGPLALATIATGVFRRYLQRPEVGSINVSLDDAMHISSTHVFELARFSEQCQPGLFEQVRNLMLQNPVCLKTLSAVLLLRVIQTQLRRRRAVNDRADNADD